MGDFYAICTWFDMVSKINIGKQADVLSSLSVKFNINVIIYIAGQLRLLFIRINDKFLFIGLSAHRKFRFMQTAQNGGLVFAQLSME
ncbi:MAG: hypothetical protein IJD59_03165 [Clostridia bacterium]|nr:hypothetical protein [Clostridia bacterium]